MRGALASPVVVLALALSGCPDPPPPSRIPFDASLPVHDVGIPIDGGMDDAFDWPDTGPPLPTVLPAQSWIIDLMVGADTFEVTIDIDARAEAGIVRAVGGAGGRASSVIFDVLPGGLLRARSPIPMGLPGDHTCSYDLVTVDQWALQFDDPDGDGIHDHLAMATSGTTITRSGPNMPGFPTADFVFVRGVRADATPPAITLGRDHPVGRFDHVQVLASEPMDPSFMPVLVGPRTLVLVPELGASAPARWTVDTHTAPPGHYVLRVDPPSHDLAGLAPIAIPTLELDVPDLAPPAIDDVDASVVGVLGEQPTTILGDDPGETALIGATSLLAQGRTVLVLDSQAGRHTMSMTMRFEGPSDAFSVLAYVTIFDEHGTLVGQTTNYQPLFPPATVTGFSNESPVSPISIAYGPVAAGRLYALIEPAGPGDPSCSGVTAPAGVAVVLDGITVM